jgi:hypothetical protein
MHKKRPLLNFPYSEAELDEYELPTCQHCGKPVRPVTVEEHHEDYSENESWYHFHLNHRECLYPEAWRGNPSL